MSAISPDLLKTIFELQSLKSFKGSALGGGTNLAIRYDHRISTDVDIFFPFIIGKDGYKAIEQEVLDFYGNNVFGLQYPCAKDDQYIFLRFFVQREDETIKVEILQNMKMMEDIEEIHGIQMVSELDIALFKMMSAANRATEKDIYDLDLITGKFPLSEIFKFLSKKQSTFCKEADKNIFDMDGEVSPIDDPLTLLKFEGDGNAQGSSSKPHHSRNRVDIIDGQKKWSVARISWRTKVRALFKELEVPFPDITSSDIN